MVAFSEWLNRELKKRQKYANRLAEDLGVSHGAVGKWVRGESRPSKKNCEKIADLFGLPEEDVFEAAGHWSPPKRDNAVVRRFMALVRRMSPEEQRLALEIVEDRYARDRAKRPIAGNRTETNETAH